MHEPVERWDEWRSRQKVFGFSEVRIGQLSPTDIHCSFSTHCLHHHHGEIQHYYITFQCPSSTLLTPLCIHQSNLINLIPQPHLQAHYIYNHHPPPCIRHKPTRLLHRTCSYSTTIHPKSPYSSPQCPSFAFLKTPAFIPTTNPTKSQSPPSPTTSITTTPVPPSPTPLLLTPPSIPSTLLLSGCAGVAIGCAK